MMNILATFTAIGSEIDYMPSIGTRHDFSLHSGQAPLSELDSAGGISPNLESERSNSINLLLICCQPAKLVLSLNMVKRRVKLLAALQLCARSLE